MRRVKRRLLSLPWLRATRRRVISTGPFLRIVTWNCGRGQFQNKVPYVKELSPSVAVLQEIAHPKEPNGPQQLWFGDNLNQGVAIVAGEGYSLEPGPIAPDAPTYVIPVSVTGPASFNLLAIWAVAKHRYVEVVWKGLDFYQEFLHSAPAVIAGDFNSNADFRYTNRISHTALVERLANEFGMVSTYHTFFRRREGWEGHPTLYFRHHQHEPFHIDYCFIPKAWSHRIQQVAVGGYEEWKGRSDHRPLIVDVGIDIQN